MYYSILESDREALAAVGVAGDRHEDIVAGGHPELGDLKYHDYHYDIILQR